ncbi:DUF2203 domain-containing protein [Candidatus Woesearchaeota archaeon]|nr:DUF2203 domain-containing protein [Candidatus Woesearchaeota archaeon]
MKRTFFTLEQARLMLPEVQKHLRKINRLQRQLLFLDSIDIQHDDPEQDDKIQRVFEKEFHHASYLLYQELEKVEKKGVIVRDLNQGLIDFRSTFEGREIFLCWCLGEDTIRFWHEADDGYQGRRSIHDLQKDKFHIQQSRRERKAVKKQTPKKISVLRK